MKLTVTRHVRMGLKLTDMVWEAYEKATTAPRGKLNRVLGVAVRAWLDSPDLVVFGKIYVESRGNYGKNTTVTRAAVTLRKDEWQRFDRCFLNERNRSLMLRQAIGEGIKRPQFTRMVQLFFGTPNKGEPE